MVRHDGGVDDFEHPQRRRARLADRDELLAMLGERSCPDQLPQRGDLQGVRLLPGIQIRRVSDLATKASQLTEKPVAAPQVGHR